MVTKNKTTTKSAKKGRVKTLNLKRETIKNLTSREKKKIKGGGGAASGIVMGYRTPSGNL
jgi:hypothetical protein